MLSPILLTQKQRLSWLNNLFEVYYWEVAEPGSE